MTTNLRSRIEQKRGTKNTFWVLLIFAKDILWHIKDKVRNTFIMFTDIKKNKLLYGYSLNEYSRSGVGLWGYFYFRSFLDENGFIKIPDGVTQIKLDVGLSHSAPNSVLWLNSLSDRLIFGFEPHPENVRKVMASKKIEPYFNNRFYVFQIAIDDADPGIREFHITKEDPGTSSLYKPNQMAVKKIIGVPHIRLSDFLSCIPWNKIPYIEHIKVDTQGNDLRVLQSLGDYLSQHVVFVTAEFSTENQYSHSHKENELDEFMELNNFHYIESSRKGYDKTYMNSKFNHLIDKLDYSTI